MTGRVDLFDAMDAPVVEDAAPARAVAVKDGWPRVGRCGAGVGHFAGQPLLAWVILLEVQRHSFRLPYAPR